MPPVGAAIGAAVTGDRRLDLDRADRRRLLRLRGQGVHPDRDRRRLLGRQPDADARAEARDARACARASASARTRRRRSSSAATPPPATSSMPAATGDDNEYYVLVLELSDLPARLRRVMVNGDWVTLSATDGKRGSERRRVPPQGRGPPLGQVLRRPPDRRQRHPARRIYGDDPDRPWEADMIGRGIPYAVVTARFDPEVHRGVPELLFELDGARLYDPRRDSSVGGSGPAALEQPGELDAASAIRPTRTRSSRSTTSCSGCATRSPTSISGAARDIRQRDLPVASWFAAMNECDALTPAGDSGLEEPQYRAGHRDRARGRDRARRRHRGAAEGLPGPDRRGRRRLGDPRRPAGCRGLRLQRRRRDRHEPGGARPVPRPRPGLQRRQRPLPRARGRLGRRRKRRSGSTPATGPRTAAGCGSHRCSSRPSPYRAQVQRLMASALKDGRRFRRHTVVLPPEARALGPLDVVEWTSARHGYEDKQFTVDLARGPAERLRRAWRCARSTRRTTTSPPATCCRRRSGSSAGRRGCRSRSTSAPRASACPTPPAPPAGPAIKLDWNPTPRASGVRYQLQLLDRPDELPLLGGHDYLRRRPEPELPRGVRRASRSRSSSDEPLVAAYISRHPRPARRSSPPASCRRRLPHPRPLRAERRLVRLDRGRRRRTPGSRRSTSTPRSTPASTTRRARPTPPPPTPPPRSPPPTRRWAGRRGAGRRHHRRSRGAARRLRRLDAGDIIDNRLLTLAGAADRLERRPDLPALDLRQPGEVDGDRAQRQRRPVRRLLRRRPRARHPARARSP